MNDKITKPKIGFKSRVQDLCAQECVSDKSFIFLKKGMFFVKGGVPEWDPQKRNRIF